MKIVLRVVLLLVCACLSESNDRLTKLFEWNSGQVKFIVDDPLALRHLLHTKQYIPKNNVPLGIAVHPLKKAMFVTVPRWKKGVASTLNWCAVGTGNLREPLHPYPNWQVNNIYSNHSSPYKIYSVIRVHIDACHRLWAVDNGKDDKCGVPKKYEPAKILVFDLKKDVLIHMHVFSSDIEFPKSSFGKILVDVDRENCGKAFVYITDVRYPGLVVYDLKKNKSFRIQLSYFEREPLKSHFYIRGEKHQSNNHIDGICLSGRYRDGYRNLYVSAQTSNKQFITSTKFVQDKKYKNSSNIIFYLGKRCDMCQSGGAQVMDKKRGVMFYSELNRDALSCWNGDHDHYSPATQDHIAVSPELNFISDIVLTPSQDELALISCQLREFMYSDNGVVTRVFVGKVEALVQGTVCAPKYKCRKCKHC